MDPSDFSITLANYIKDFFKEFLNIFEFQTIILLSVVVFIYVSHATEDLTVQAVDMETISTIKLLNIINLILMIVCLVISIFAHNQNILYLIIWVIVFGLSIASTVLIKGIYDKKKTKDVNGNEVDCNYSSPRYDTAYIVNIVMIVLAILYFGIDLFLWFKERPATPAM
jgi:cytochrome bd-type quinol oxidase subunit 2